MHAPKNSKELQFQLFPPSGGLMKVLDCFCMALRVIPLMRKVQLLHRYIIKKLKAKFFHRNTLTNIVLLSRSFETETRNRTV